eukprot:TRINITY_DN17_c0_g1_i1.p1 TRINITY_DN17_c0_g1~~TRINITY_DN17_c0_g1_i1.p1  ORF type:complete len:287 (-),score=79.67 TRINITY_DN17_c0_g1_i1:26-886(-)
MSDTDGNDDQSLLVIEDALGQSGESAPAGGLEEMDDSAQLEFQDISHEDEIPLDDMEDVETGDGKDEKKPLTTKEETQDVAPSFYHLAYWKTFFDVDTRDVLVRMLSAIFPVHSNFLIHVGKSVDMYGPFWVATTLIFIVGVASNLAAYLHSSDNSPWSYDFTRIVVASSVIYGYLFLMPSLVWLFLRYHSVPATLAEVICVYGYAYTPFFFVAAICVGPSELVRWISIFVAYMISSTFICLSLKPFWGEHMKNHRQILIGGILFFHFILMLFFKFSFFRYEYVIE